ncbi:hypothetical protein [Amorphus orientalis]|uniref:Uncharacterized protein n=1 Tax=Amorphus orientalis TaxID=649198 RepID=A0AAE4AS96_9HYPH|nr:hypothetical protein [Amorphus orientalis]MDQ0314877.1 hypothetical protein [Amorphus orientalis]
MEGHNPGERDPAAPATAEYVAAICKELRTLAINADMFFLGYLLLLSVEEASYHTFEDEP